jgi:hypothetical protein
MSRTHRVIFFFIGLLAVATFLFGVLQFVNLHLDHRADQSRSGTNRPVSTAPDGKQESRPK